MSKLQVIPLYFISKDRALEGAIEPFYIKSKRNPIPVKHISVAPSIKQAFQMSYSMFGTDFEIKDVPAVTAYVYRAVYKPDDILVPPEVLAKERLSRSSHVTGEHWFMSTTQFVMDCVVSIANTNDSALVPYNPYSDKRCKLKYLAPEEVNYRVVQKM